MLGCPHFPLGCCRLDIKRSGSYYITLACFTDSVHDKEEGAVHRQIYNSFEFSKCHLKLWPVLEIATDCAVINSFVDQDRQTHSKMESKYCITVYFCYTLNSQYAQGERNIF